jgi:hypothetical protein
MGLLRGIKLIAVFVPTGQQKLAMRRETDCALAQANMD